MIREDWFFSFCKKVMSGEGPIPASWEGLKLRKHRQRGIPRLNLAGNQSGHVLPTWNGAALTATTWISSNSDWETDSTWSIFRSKIISIQLQWTGDCFVFSCSYSVCIDSNIKVPSLCDFVIESFGFCTLWRVYECHPRLDYYFAQWLDAFAKLGSFSFCQILSTLALVETEMRCYL